MPVQFRYSPQQFPIPPLLGCLPLLAILFLMCLIPMALFDAGHDALLKLGLSPFGAVGVLLGIIFGSTINFPLYEFRRDELEPESLGPLSDPDQMKTYRRIQQQVLIGINLGGGVIPIALACLQIIRLREWGTSAWIVAGIVAAASVIVCYFLARPVPGIGILLPALVPPVVSVLGTWLLLPDASSAQRAATAFIAGVTGPVIGADLLHLKDLQKTTATQLSIGGAGTFDGIVFSGILAALFA